MTAPWVCYPFHSPMALLRWPPPLLYVLHHVVVFDRLARIKEVCLFKLAVVDARNHRLVLQLLMPERLFAPIHCLPRPTPLPLRTQELVFTRFRVCRVWNVSFLEPFLFAMVQPELHSYFDFGNAERTATICVKECERLLCAVPP